MRHRTRAPAPKTSLTTSSGTVTSTPRLIYPSKWVNAITCTNSTLALSVATMYR